MIANRTQVRIKQGNTSTTVERKDGEVNVADVLSPELVALLSKRVGDVQAVYIEVITK